ncbi:glycoside hydrolase 100 family protein [Sphingobacterium bovisgrunnientis]|uniref:glycoside hydrolase 100 family protein n=1 Tax=Sphingobacterium bovisgrunnientis TaxID=1874697 RepID=UPI001357F667|nr:glycoside hydrolase 100 family protein [Sphingobacterium bovisgrunnientis]
MLTKLQIEELDAAKIAALDVLLNNMNGPFHNLPRTAGWGYPEPYTRDLLLSIFGIASTKNAQLYDSVKNVLEVLADHQTVHGHIPSIVFDPNNLGASDTTPLFLMAVGIYRLMTGDSNFLEEAVNKSLIWMQYQCPNDDGVVAQQPTSDWRDEQWVLGYGLYVNTVYHIALQVLGFQQRADRLSNILDTLFTIEKQYYALWTYKIFNSEKFDLLGNSLAILSGIASAQKADAIIQWVENSCESMRKENILSVDLPPNFFPFIYPVDREWHERYREFNQPGDYHNGGIWPFICGFYIAALVKSQHFDLAEEKLVALTSVIKKSTDIQLEFGFNEWLKSQDGVPYGQDWQTWSAAMYLYAAQSVQNREASFF